MEKSFAESELQDWAEMKLDYYWGTGILLSLSFACSFLINIIWSLLAVPNINTQMNLFIFVFLAFGAVDLWSFLWFQNANRYHKERATIINSAIRRRTIDRKIKSPFLDKRFYIIFFLLSLNQLIIATAAWYLSNPSSPYYSVSKHKGAER